MKPHPTPFSFVRKLQQANNDELYEMRHKEVTVDSQCIPNPFDKYVDSLCRGVFRGLGGYISIMLVSY